MVFLHLNRLIRAAILVVVFVDCLGCVRGITCHYSFYQIVRLLPAAVSLRFTEMIRQARTLQNNTRHRVVVRNARSRVRRSKQRGITAAHTALVKQPDLVSLLLEQTPHIEIE